MIANGVIYALLMAGYVLALVAVKQWGWSGGEIVALAVVVSLLIVALALHRLWLSRADRAERDQA